ncbi:UbiX family flavin prenyltransferase [Francisella philomiragia]|uniref:Flavin prenyltransferase UbiX n=1 Tax=Francisella philomiragia TaxID=28110 RepID=A0AAW3DDA2_9GAMM|nr:UbiX family flavin prenyltransferase [Francisella philomiragia]KFJ43632.1 polyprenyl P-hydroxybenzoate and phenylacrylic acid decarboxylase family protein [Francisella philomiragia]MBK2254417.1 UbiX family flavin prenyltransferase [Francisella philomiragia]MBK2258957.1 UbiX family flavin prenyltransferase [Francisella philomiragia]MBK2272790.1 UbiX family flavin prenyltransferase [Francisella philomiragia]MBK2276571.1 UbiX family flavin prenyltransferase [Francisella philomiragia]
MEPKKIIIAITGASGYQYGVIALKLLKQHNIETHLILSKTSELTRSMETDYTLDEVKALATHVNHVNNLASCLSSGSYRPSGMLIAPCSMKTLAEIANGIADNLISRTADVILKERKPLILLARETPLSLIHIENMKKVTLAGGIIMPPVPSLYIRPTSLDELLEYTVIRSLDLLGIDVDSCKRWVGNDLDN